MIALAFPFPMEQISRGVIAQLRPALPFGNGKDALRYMCPVLHHSLIEIVVDIV